MIKGTTCLVGLLGQPVSHSLSPAMHNAALKALEIDWCYLAMPCEPKNIPSVLKGLRELGCKGLNITIPHKKSAAINCDELSPLAKSLDAVNTLIPIETGGWKGTNTDVEGFLAPLRYKELKRKRAMVIGCGGSSKAVIEGLKELELDSIVLVGRKAFNLNNCLKEIKKNQFNEKNYSLKGLLATDIDLINEIRQADLIINTTPVGMTNIHDKQTSQSAIPLDKKVWSNLTQKTILYDLIYTPETTAWLTLGKSKGCEIINGLEMLIHQGAASLRLWTGIDHIPIDIMREAAKNTLHEVS